MAPLVVFSYKVTSGAQKYDGEGDGGNAFVARVQTGLERQGCKVEMRHGSASGHSVTVDRKQTGANSHSTNFEEWMVFWKGMADQATIVVLFDSDDQGYNGSSDCQAEARYAKAHCKHCCMGKYIDGGEPAEKIAERIWNKI